MRLMLTAALVFCLLLPAAAQKQPAQPTLHTNSISQTVDRYLQPYVAGKNFTGVVLIAKGGKVLLNKGYGLADYELNVPNTPATRFHIASVSKPFTALAILQLAEQGKLGLDDAVEKYVTGFPHGDKITLRHLLTHTSGIANINNFPEYNSLQRMPQTPKSLVDAFKDKPLDFEPGAKYAYSNSNYNLLALVIELVSHQSYGEYLEQHIFYPLQMKATFHHGDAHRLIPHRAAGYSPVGTDGLELADFVDWSSKTGNGSLVSTAGDLFMFAQVVGTGILYPKAKFASLLDERPGSHYGWFVRKRFGRRVWAANGRSPGFTASLERFPDDDLTIIVLSNSYSPVSQDPIAADLAAIALDQPLPKPEVLVPVKLSEEELKDWAGHYAFGADFFRPNAEVEMRPADGRLKMDWGNNFFSDLIPVSDHEFIDRLFWARVRFEKDAEGQVKQFVYRSSGEYVAVKK